MRRSHFAAEQTGSADHESRRRVLIDLVGCDAGDGGWRQISNARTRDREDVADFVIGVGKDDSSTVDSAYELIARVVNILECGRLLSETVYRPYKVDGEKKCQSRRKPHQTANHHLKCLRGDLGTRKSRKQNTCLCWDSSL